MTRARVLYWIWCVTGVAWGFMASLWFFAEHSLVMGLVCTAAGCTSFIVAMVLPGRLDKP